MHRPASQRARPRSPFWRIPLAVGLAAALGGTLMATHASAATATGPDGQTVTVSTADGLNPDGETVTATGSGFDLGKGIYVALCVDNGSGQVPSPCLGGVDTEGSGGASAWISSNPPGYGEGLAEPFDEVDGKGSFSVELRIAARDSVTDCLDPAIAPNGCVIGTRTDHTRTADRSADVLIPVTFAAPGGGEKPPGDAMPTPTSTPTDPAEQQDLTGTETDPSSTPGADDPDDLAGTGTSQTVLAAVAALLLAVAGGALVVVRRQARHISS